MVVDVDKVRQRLEQIKQGKPAGDVAWLVQQLEEVLEENRQLKGEVEWLKKELAYSEFQGEVGY